MMAWGALLTIVQISKTSFLFFSRQYKSFQLRAYSVP